MPIKIDFLAGTNDFVRGVDDADKALDKVADSLDDVADAAKTDGRDAERSVERLESSFRDAARRAQDLGKAGKDAGDDVKRGMKDAERGVDEFKDEANSTAREAAASFDGSAESISDAFQEIAANAFAGFGPAGALAGLAAAAGIGAAAAGFEAVSEAEQASRERAAEWAAAYVEAGSRVLSASTTTAMALDIVTDAEKFKTAQDNAKSWGVDVSVAIAAMTGEAWALAAANDALTKKEDAATAAAVRQADGGEALADMLVGTTAQARAGRDALNELTKEMDSGGAGADAYSRYLIAMTEHTDGAARAVDEFGDTVVTLPDGKQIYIDAETGKATDNVTAIEKQIYGVPDSHHTTLTASADLSQAIADINAFLYRDITKVINVVTTTFGDGKWD